MSSSSLHDFQRVLSGEETNCDDLDERGQGAVRASWDERLNYRMAHLNLAAEFTQAQRSCAKTDA